MLLCSGPRLVYGSPRKIKFRVHEFLVGGQISQKAILMSLSVFRMPDISCLIYLLNVCGSLICHMAQDVGMV